MAGAGRLFCSHLISSKYFTDTGDWEAAATAACGKWKETSGGGFGTSEGGKRNGEVGRDGFMVGLAAFG